MTLSSLFTGKHAKVKVGEVSVSSSTTNVSSKKHESLWSLNSIADESERDESPRRKQLNKAAMISIIVAVVLVTAAAIAIPIGVVLGMNKNKSCTGAKESSVRVTLNTSATRPCGSPAVCSAFSHGGVFNEDSDVPGMYQRSLLNPETWLDRTGFNTTFTDEQVGGLSVMGLNASYVPILEEWDYKQTPMKGVNLGGWLVLEPFITPSKFGGDIVDEWSLCQSLYKQNGAARVQRILETHYATFITENDFKEIAEAGLDHVRIPFGYWLVDEAHETPYLPFVGWRYLLRGIEWARKYNLRVFLDLHAVPGSQNGWNHSGRMSDPEWLSEKSPRGEEYGEQTLEIHRKLSKFFSQERYRNLVMFYGLVNEPLTVQLGPKRVVEWHQKAYKIVTEEGGFPHYVVLGDGLMGPQYYNQGQFSATSYPKMVLDLHQYMVFDKFLLGLPHGAKNAMVCHEWAQQLNHTDMPLLVGEWSAAVNDCGAFVNDVGVGTRWEGNFTGNTNAESVTEPICAGGVCTCQHVTTATMTDPMYRQYLRAFASNQMGIYQQHSWGWMFWTWKTENNPQWSLQTLLNEGIVQLTETPVLDDTTRWDDLGLSESI